MKPPVLVFGRETEDVLVKFVFQELRWLRREARRRKLTHHEMLNVLIGAHYKMDHFPPQFYSKRKRFKEDMFSGIVNDIIRVARLAQSWRKDGRVA